MTRSTRSSTSSRTGRGSSGSCSTASRPTRWWRRRSTSRQVGRAPRPRRLPAGRHRLSARAPGPGIRRILHGELTIDRGDGEAPTYRAGEAWFEGADDPVLATASATQDTAFVRVLLLPGEWAGRRTIRYLDPADEAKPRLQPARSCSRSPCEAQAARSSPTSSRSTAPTSPSAFRRATCPCSTRSTTRRSALSPAATSKARPTPQRPTGSSPAGPGSARHARARARPRPPSACTRRSRSPLR